MITSQESMARITGVSAGSIQVMLNQKAHTTNIPSQVVFAALMGTNKNNSLQEQANAKVNDGVWKSTQECLTLITAL
jgi:hypothetical protein